MNPNEYQEVKSRDPNPILIDEKSAKNLFTDEQIKLAKEGSGRLSDKYILNQ